MGRMGGWRRGFNSSLMSVEKMERGGEGVEGSCQTF